jgi:hypothetical protein
MNNYDPLRDPKPTKWLEIDEQERISLIAKYHKKAGVRLPNVHLHAAIHTIVENQLAEGLPVACETLSRLMQEGLDRHDAIHAIGSVLTEHIFNVLDAGANSDANERYYQGLRALTAAKWRSLSPR